MSFVATLKSVNVISFEDKGAQWTPVARALTEESSIDDILSNIGVTVFCNV